MSVARIGSASSKPKNPEQRPEQQLRREHQRRREVDRPPRDVGHDQIAIDILDEEIDEDRPKALVGPGAEADRDHQHAGDDRADIGEEGEQAGEQAEQRRHRHAAERQHDDQVKTPSNTMPTSRPNSRRRRVEPDAIRR